MTLVHQPDFFKAPKFIGDLKREYIPSREERDLKPFYEKCATHLLSLRDKYRFGYHDAVDAARLAEFADSVSFSDRLYYVKCKQATLSCLCCIESDIDDQLTDEERVHVRRIVDLQFRIEPAKLAAATDTGIAAMRRVLVTIAKRAVQEAEGLRRAA